MNIGKINRLKWMAPILLFLSVIIDAALPGIFPQAFLGHAQIITSHILLYFITVFAFYFRDANILISSFIFGFFYDSYNTTVLGLNATLYLVVAYLILKLKRNFPKKTYVHYMLFVVSIVLVDLLIYFFYLEINVAGITLLEFLAARLAPTLIFNTVVAIILYYPTRNLMRWLGYKDFIII